MPNIIQEPKGQIFWWKIGLLFWALLNWSISPLCRTLTFIGGSIFCYFCEAFDEGEISYLSVILDLIKTWLVSLWFYYISVRLGGFSDDFVYLLNVTLLASSNFTIFVTVPFVLMGLMDPVLLFLRLSNMSSIVDLLAMIRYVWREMRYVSQSMGALAKAMTITPIMKFGSLVSIY